MKNFVAPPDFGEEQINLPQSNDLEAKLYAHAHKLLRAHEILLRDAVRNRAFYKALETCVTSDSVVLDIGAGTGVWAIIAAKLGAKKVFAVERDELLIGLIKMLAGEQGVAEKVVAVCGNSFDIELEKEFDLVISETIGYLGYDENIVEIMLDARRRFLKSGGLLIPETVSLFAAAAHLKTERETVPNGLPLDFKRLAKLNLNSPRVWNNKRDLRFITKPQRLIQTDLYRAAEQPALENLRASWNAPNAGSINCFVVWVESRLTKGARFSTRRTSSWLPNIYRVAPPEENFTRVEFELSLTEASNYWTTTFSNAQTRKTRRYSPEFAAAEMTLYSRTGDLTLIERLNAEMNFEADF